MEAQSTPPSDMSERIPEELLRQSNGQELNVTIFRPYLTRAIYGHGINGINEKIIVCADTPTHGNASHYYEASADVAPKPEGGDNTLARIQFQNGPLATTGFNGVTNEVLLAIVADRLRGFQGSSYSCRENSLALTKIEEALHWLHERTKNRERRGVEGTHIP